MPVKFSTYELSIVTFTEPMLVMFDAEKVIPTTSTEQTEKQIISKWRAFITRHPLAFYFLKTFTKSFARARETCLKYLKNNQTNSDFWFYDMWGKKCKGSLSNIFCVIYLKTWAFNIPVIPTMQNISPQLDIQLQRVPSSDWISTTVHELVGRIVPDRNGSNAVPLLWSKTTVR